MSMKKFNQFLTIILLIGIMAGCKKESIFTYNAFDSIYFNSYAGGQPIDTTAVTFAYSPVAITDSTLKVPFKITGLPADHDRSYNVIVDTGTTAVSGKHFILPATFIFRAGRLLDSLPIKLLRTTDLQSKAMILRLKLQPTSDLHNDLKTTTTLFGQVINLTSFKLNISDMLGQGQYWSGVFNTYFGAFSIKKVRLINQITGMPLNYYTTGWLTDLNLNARAGLYAITMARYLSDQKAAGNAIYEDNGVTPMVMGAAYQ
jgi:hypothetical protein